MPCAAAMPGCMDLRSCQKLTNEGRPQILGHLQRVISGAPVTAPEQ